MNKLKKKNRLQSGNSGDDKRKTYTVKSVTHEADKIKIVIQQPGEISQIIEIPNTLKAFQQAVGGYIEVINLGNGLIGVIDEEGRIILKAPKRYGSLSGVVRISPEAEIILQKLSDKTGLSMRVVASQMIIQGEALVSIEEE